MGKNRTLTNNDTQNFILKGSNSIQIGIYLLLFVFILKSLLDGFLSDVSMLGMMSIEIIESVGFSLIVLLILLSATALFFSSRRTMRKAGFKLWNKISRKQFIIYFVASFALLFGLSFLKSLGFSNFLGPLFLLSFGIILLISNAKRKKTHLLLSGISAILAVLVFLIPSYWYSAILILGAALIVYGIMIRK